MCVHQLLPAEAVGELNCLCFSTAECLFLDDGDGCTGIFACDIDGGLGVCAVHPATVPQCDDGLWCNGLESCLSPAGSCLPGQPPDLDDGVGCTLDLCDEDGDEVVHLPLDEACADGNGCTDDLCLAEGCVNPDNQLPCDDGDLCTGDDLCSGGLCAGSPLPCDDGEPCTLDWCDGGQCLHGALGCDDGDLCTVDLCIPGAGCQHSALDCDDGNPCTSESCKAGLGCVGVPLPDNSSCPSDGNPCTADLCLGGVCTHDDEGWSFLPPYGCFMPILVQSPWLEADERCRSLGAHAAAVYAQEHLEALAGLSGTDEEFWVGLSDSLLPGAFAYGQGGSLYANWGPGQPAGAGTRCAYVATGAPELPMVAADCHLTEKPYAVCERNPAGTNGGANCEDGLAGTADIALDSGGCAHPAAPDGYPCPGDDNPCSRDYRLAGQCQHEAGGWLLMEPYGCFLKLVDKKRSWHQARHRCRELGGDLATVYDDAHWDQKLWQTNNPLWIGFHDLEQEGDFRWANGGSSHSVWAFKEPYGVEFGTQAMKDCVRISPPTPKPFMYPEFCAAEQYAVCERNPNGTCGGRQCDDGDPCTVDTCVEGECFHDGHGFKHFAPYGCFRGGDNWAGWESARAACRVLFGDLASVYDELQRLWLVGHYVQALPCGEGGCPVWLGLNDLDREGEPVWANGAASAADWWSAGSANGADLDCGQCDPQQGYGWRLAECSQAIPFVCEWNPAGTCGADRCDDQQFCTEDKCLADGRCGHAWRPDSTPCPDEGDPCTRDLCLAGKCSHVADGWHYLPSVGCVKLLPDGVAAAAAVAGCEAVDGELAVAQAGLLEWLCPALAEGGLPAWLAGGGLGADCLECADCNGEGRPLCRKLPASWCAFDSPCDDGNPCTLDSCTEGLCQFDSEGFVHHPPHGCFKLLPGELWGWREAQRECLKSGANLATIHDDAHLASLQSWLLEEGEELVHLGLNDIVVEGQWAWLNGGGILPLPWKSKEPSNSDGGEHGGLLEPGGASGLRDVNLDYPAGALCQRLPGQSREPAQCDDGLECTIDAVGADGACSHLLHQAWKVDQGYCVPK